MRVIIAVVCLLLLGSLMVLDAHDKPGSKSRNSTITKGSDMSNLQDSTQKGTGALPPIDTLKPARIETATFALG
jgi:hypothetical protein